MNGNVLDMGVWLDITFIFQSCLRHLTMMMHVISIYEICEYVRYVNSAHSLYR